MSYLNIVISMMMDLLTNVKSMIVSSFVKTNGETNIVLVMDMPTAHVHSTQLNVMVL